MGVKWQNWNQLCFYVKKKICLTTWMWLFTFLDVIHIVKHVFFLMQTANSLEKTLMLGKTEGRGEGDNRGWDGWMASPTQWSWTWVNSRKWWQTGKPGVLQSTGSQRVGHDLVTEQQCACLCVCKDVGEGCVCQDVTVHGNIFLKRLW